jgi:hypothetical protein
MDMGFGMWNVRSLYRAGSMKIAASELAKYNLDLVAVQEVRWVEGNGQSREGYTFLCVNENANHHLLTGFLCIEGNCINS